MPTERVEIDGSSLRRAYRQHADGSDFWVELRTERRSQESFDQVVSLVNDLLDEERTGGAQLSARSPAGYVVQVSFTEPTHFETWISTFTQRLEAARFTGSIRAASDIKPPRWLENVQRDPVTDELVTMPAEPTGFIVWSLDWDSVTPDRGTTSGWHVPADATSRITDHLADWTAPGGPEIQMLRDVFRFTISDGTQVATILAEAVTATTMAGVIRHQRRSAHGRSAQLSAGGFTAVQAIDPSAHWLDQVELLREAIVHCSDITEQAFIRPSARGARSWSSLRAKLPLPGVKERAIRYNKHLLAEYVPDAHGIQVLRDEHLAHARDLSDWSITDLGHGRHLVEARDLVPWYGIELPEPETLARAREDFGPMILTTEVVEAHKGTDR